MFFLTKNFEILNCNNLRFKGTPRGLCVKARFFKKTPIFQFFSQHFYTNLSSILEKNKFLQNKR